MLTSLYLLPHRQDSPILFCTLQRALAVMDTCTFFKHLHAFETIWMQCFRKAVFLQDWLKIFEETEDNAQLLSLQVFFLYSRNKIVSVLQSHPCSVSKSHWHPQVSLYGRILSIEILSWLWALSSHSILSPPLGSAELGYTITQKKGRKKPPEISCIGAAHICIPARTAPKSPSQVSLLCLGLSPQGCMSFPKFIFFYSQRVTYNSDVNLMSNINANCMHNREALCLNFDDDGDVEHFIRMLVKP